MSEIYTFTTTRRRFGVSSVQTGKHQVLMRKLAKGGKNVIALPKIEHLVTLPALKPVFNMSAFIGMNKKKSRRRQIGRNQVEARKNQAEARFASKLRNLVSTARPEV